jgi:hypothetical protein
MPRVEFEPMTAVFERAKTVHALDRAATVNCLAWLCLIIYIRETFESKPGVLGYVFVSK